MLPYSDAAVGPPIAGQIYSRMDRQCRLASITDIEYKACTQPHETEMSMREAKPQMRALA